MTVTLLVFALLGVVIIALALFALVHADRQRRHHLRRLRRMRPEMAQPAPKARRRTAGPDGQNSFFATIEGHLAQTSLRVSIMELLVQISLGTLTLYAVLVLLLGVSPLLALPVSLLTPAGFAVLVINFAKSRYREAFTAQLPEALDVFARGLRAGRPVSDSLGIVVENAKGPTQREFSRCYDEICMGTTLPESLARLEGRIPTAEVSFFSVATSLQAETGGNLIETMEGLAGQLRERRKLRLKARALSSEARASAVILAALPFAVALAIGLLNGQYLEPLYADNRGQIMALGAVCSIGLGVFMMVRMGKLDV